MTRPQMETPLRRSEVGAFRTPVQTPVVNDDEAERREARRRTTNEISTPAVEESETLKNCLQQCNDKLSRDNAWSVSVIDTLSALMSKHHKTLSNFKVAGTSLEASSRVYALRVDSVHSEVVRISSGLGNKKGHARVSEDEASQETEVPVQGEGMERNGEVEPPIKRKKRSRKPLSTITKNKDTINAALDTNPFTDPLFAKLNSGVGNVSGSNRLLQNVLHSIDSELRLRMDYPFWEESESEPVVYSDEYDYTNLPTVDAELITQLKSDGTVLRPQLCGYIISDTPAEHDSSDEESRSDAGMPMEDDHHDSQMAVAFDVNAVVECNEPATQQFVDVDMGEFDELTIEEQTAINNCKGLRRAPVVIEDMRPVDSSSLEYSYRPLDKISQFWAGPSHWKFKKSRSKSISLALRFSSNQTAGDNARRLQNQRNKRRPLKMRVVPLEFAGIHDNLFQKLDGKSKLRKANIAKKWDAKKLKLPTDLQIDKDVFDVFCMAPGLQVMEQYEPAMTPDLPDEGSNFDYEHVNDIPCGDIPNDDIDMDTGDDIPESQVNAENLNHTVMEIASDFIGAPDKVTKIIVPFAKRAKVIDMKQLKKCCVQLIDQQMQETLNENLSQPKGFDSEKYKPGVASFNKTYVTLPRLLTSNMNDALSTSIAFYSILHLANEGNYRLIMDETLDDFQIRKIDD